jgi:hypothetical protein
VIVNDRLLVPNTAETFASLEPDLKSFFNTLYNRTEYTLAHHADPRERFTINITTESSFDVETLLNHISVETAHA